jgi:hypothetical protein
MLTTKKNYFHKLFIVLTLVSIFNLTLSPALAQTEATHTAETTEVPRTPPPPFINPVNLTVSPVTLNLVTDPGKPVTSSIKVFNNNTEKEYLEIKLAKFSADRTGSKPKISDFEPSDQYQNWFTFEKDKFEVNPGEWETIDLEFAPPQDSALTYYYAIIIKRQETDQEENSTTIVTGAPAILVLTTIYSPNAIQELQLVEFRTKEKFYEYLPAEFQIDIKNTGNIHLSPIGNIFIDKGEKKDIALLSINKENGLVLPNSERTYTSNWTQGYPAYEPVLENGTEKKDDKGNTVYKLNWDLSKINQFRFGKYTANMLLVYDNGERDIPIESALTFWVFPWKIILGGIIVSSLLIIGIISPIITLINKMKIKENENDKI